jgi:hypothetical protein
MRAVIAADRLQRIALELTAVAPGAPIFLTQWLDTANGEPLALTSSATAPIEGTPSP